MRNRPAPAPDQAAFVALCKELRELGAVKVSGHGFEAVFAPPVQKLVAPAPREVPKPAHDAPPPVDARAAFRADVLSIAEKAGRHG
ncbi:MAG TPA: hypothetical protein VGK73_31395 [Polyangiaceae bacterium]